MVQNVALGLSVSNGLADRRTGKEEVALTELRRIAETLLGGLAKRLAEVAQREEEAKASQQALERERRDLEIRVELHREEMDSERQRVRSDRGALEKERRQMESLVGVN